MWRNHHNVRSTNLSSISFYVSRRSPNRPRLFECAAFEGRESKLVRSFTLERRLCENSTLSFPSPHRIRSTCCFSMQDTTRCSGLSTVLFLHKLNTRESHPHRPTMAVHSTDLHRSLDRVSYCICMPLWLVTRLEQDALAKNRPGYQRRSYIF